MSIIGFDPAPKSIQHLLFAAWRGFPGVTVMWWTAPASGI